MAQALDSSFSNQVKPSTLWCVGRNYKDHAQELGNPIPDKPLIFLKAGACLSKDSTIRLPETSKEIHHEIELALYLGDHLEPRAVALALDLTARDHQKVAKQRGEPWSLAKSFPGSCPISPWVKFEGSDWFATLRFHLKVNGHPRQEGETKDMIFSVDHLISYLKEHFPLTPGDIVLTGTPAGVGPLKRGDHLEAQLDDLHWQLECAPAFP